jgi:hypothetical protein
MRVLAMYLEIKPLLQLWVINAVAFQATTSALCESRTGSYRFRNRKMYAYVIMHFYFKYLYRIVFEKLIVAQVVKKFHDFYATPKVYCRVHTSVLLVKDPF